MNGARGITLGGDGANANTIIFNGSWGLAASGTSTSSRSGHHYRTASSRLDSMDFVEIVREFFGRLEGQADNLVAEILCFSGEFASRFSRCHRSRSFPFELCGLPPAGGRESSDQMFGFNSGGGLWPARTAEPLVIP